MKPDTDIAILGAGCAGLSLATALAASGQRTQVHLLEPRTEYVRDRTWCFWNTEEHPFTSAISHSWNSWRVSTGQGQALCSSRRYRYCHIAADAFYRDALGRIERQPEHTLSLGITVREVTPHASGSLAIETSAGRLLAKQVFDSRPLAGNRAQPPAMVQRFVGWRVRTAKAFFDPSTVELMRFLPSDAAGRLRFVYVLPFAQNDALVEMTYLDQPTLAEPDYDRDLRSWLDEHAPGWQVVATERGALPMHAGQTPAVPFAQLHRIGTPAGRIKASSGYGFLRIQRHSQAIAEALRTGRLLPSRAELALYRPMDAVFLAALQHSTAQAQALFLRLFAAADADAVVRFLSEASSPAEMLRVAWALPKLPMLRAALRAAWPQTAQLGGHA